MQRCKYIRRWVDTSKPFPELILKTGGSEANYWYTIYTVIDGELIDCGGLSGGHTGLYTKLFWGEIWI